MKAISILGLLITLFIFSAFSTTIYKQEHELLLEKVISALKKEDFKLFLSTCVPDQQAFDELLKAEYSLSPRLMETKDTKAVRDSIISKLKLSFERLLEEGKKNNLEWGKIELVRTGIKSTSMGKVYQLELPFEISCLGKVYHLAVSSSTQLISNPSVILPGELKWLGIE